MAVKVLKKSVRGKFSGANFLNYTFLHSITLFLHLITLFLHSITLFCTDLGLIVTFLTNQNAEVVACILLVVIKDYECVRRRNFNTGTLNDFPI